MITETIHNTVQKNAWDFFFTALSDEAQDKRIYWEIITADFGSQIVTDWVSLNGLTYDRKKESLMIFTDALEHEIGSLDQVFLSAKEDKILSLAIKTVDDATHVIEFETPFKMQGVELLPPERLQASVEQHAPF